MLTVGPSCSEPVIRPLAKDAPLPLDSIFDEASYEDHIEAVSDPLSSMSSISPLVSLLALCYRSKVITDTTKSHRGQVFDSHSPDRLSALMNVMAQSPISKTHRQKEMQNSFIRLLTPILAGFAGQTDFAEAVDAFSAPDEFRSFWDFQGRNLIREVVQGEGGGDTRGSELPFMDVFVRRPNSRIALTRDGKGLILVPEEAQAGDAIFGGTGSNESQHFVVRRLMGNVKRNIGEAFTSD